MNEEDQAPAAKREEAAAVVPAATPSRESEIIDRWFSDHFPNSPVARDTAAWNHTIAAKDDLKRRFEQEEK